MTDDDATLLSGASTVGANYVKLQNAGGSGPGTVSVI